MTIFLRNEANRSVLDMEIFQKKGEDFITISPCISIREYSKLLLNNQDRAQLVIDGFDDIDNITQWYWEIYYERQIPHTQKDLTMEIIEKFLKPVCSQFDLHIVTD